MKGMQMEAIHAKQERETIPQHMMGSVKEGQILLMDKIKETLKVEKRERQHAVAEIWRPKTTAEKEIE